MEYMNYETPTKLIEGWLQHKNDQDRKWTKYWCVLKDNVIYIFKTQETSKDNHIGILTVGSDSQVKIGESDPNKGYRFDLYTTKKVNKFRTTKFIERELWKAYIVGLAEGDISDNFDLLPDQIQKVRSDIHRVMSRSTRPPLPITSPRSHMDNNSVGTGFNSPVASISSMFDKTSITSMDNGGPTIRHRFWPDPGRTDIPSWFFVSITRDIAENVLTTGRSYGNTLMRESITFRDTGSYVITKKMEHSRGPPFNHFEVIRVAEGFKINVENAHKSIKCLKDVMDYFVTMSGSAVTRPMVTNDLKVLGLDTPDYDTKIWKSKTNAESGEEDIEADYPTEAYEEPVTDSPHTSGNRKTWGPSSRQSREPRQAVPGGVTVGVGKGLRPRVNVDNIQQRVVTANVINQLDSTIDTFSSASSSTYTKGPKSPSKEYYNETDIKPTTLPRWQSRAKSVPNLQIPANLQLLNQEVPISPKGPGLVKPSPNPPRVLPKPPKEARSPTGSQGSGDQAMSAFQRQLQGVNLRPVDKKQVSFDLGAPSAPDPSLNDDENSEGMKKEDFKKKLESLIAGSGGGLMARKVMSPSASIPPHQQPAPEEEEYDEVIYEDPDDIVK